MEAWETSAVVGEFVGDVKISIILMWFYCELKTSDAQNQQASTFESLRTLPMFSLIEISKGTNYENESHVKP